MKGKYHSIYLSEERNRFIEAQKDGFSKYVNNKIDEDIAKFDTKYCESQIEHWKKQKEIATKNKTKG